MGWQHTFYCLIFLIIGINGQHDFLTTELIARIEALEAQGIEQKLHIAKQAEAIKTLETVVHTQSRRITNQDIRISSLLTRVNKQDIVLSELEKKRALNQGELTEKIAESSNTSENEGVSDKKLESKIRPSRLVLEGAVAFHARIDKYPVTHIGVNQNILFDVVVTNLGGGYHPQHGVFIAPVGGLYIFSTSVLTEHAPHQEYQANLVKNGDLLARAYGHADSGHDQGSVTVVTTLATGDEVWVSLRGPADDSIWGDSFTSFMGCLISV